MTGKKPIQIREERRGEERPGKPGSEDVERRLFGKWFKPVVGALLGLLGWLIIAQFRDTPMATAAVFDKRLDQVNDTNRVQWDKIQSNSERVAVLETKMARIESTLNETNDLSREILKIVRDKR